VCTHVCAFYACVSCFRVRIHPYAQELDIASTTDLHILMASAEKYRKGMYLTLLGDPAEKQAQLVHLLAAF